MVEHLEKGLWILQISKQGVPMAACSSHSGIEHLMQASRSYSVGAQRKGEFWRAEIILVNEERVWKSAIWYM